MVSKKDKEILLRFGNHLKILRMGKNLTFRKMALLCNIDFGDIQKIESGKTNITILTLIELAGALEVEPQALLNFFGTENTENTNR